MTDMTVEKAKEILAPLQHYKELTLYGMGPQHRVLQAAAFLEGWNARGKADAEICSATETSPDSCSNIIRDEILKLSTDAQGEK